MSKKRKRVDLEPLGGAGSASMDGDRGLTHNPFAALTGGTPGGDSKPPAVNVAPDAPGAAGSASSDVDTSGLLAQVGHERKGRGGKTVTVIELSGGPDGMLVETAGRVALDLRRSLGTGAKAIDAIIEVRGDVRDRVQAILETQYGMRVHRATR